MLPPNRIMKKDQTIEDNCEREIEKMTRINGDDTDMPPSS